MEDNIVIYADKVVNYGLYNSTEMNNYTVFISYNAGQLSEIVNCEFIKAEYELSQQQNANIAEGSQVQFVIPLTDLTTLFDKRHFFATVSVVVKAKGFSKSNHEHEYKIIYNTIQINPNVRTVIDKSNLELKELFVWIIIPSCIVLIIFIIACRSCWKGMRYNPVTDAMHLIEENPDASMGSQKIEQSNPSATALVDPSTNSVPDIRNREDV